MKLSSRDSIVLFALDIADGISWESDTSTANSMDATTTFGGVLEMTSKESVDNDSSTVELFTQNEKSSVSLPTQKYDEVFMWKKSNNIEMKEGCNIDE